ncbi:hypothetical protein V8F20_011695 [Naviculisporaceae sp. PSN 640]
MQVHSWDAEQLVSLKMRLVISFTLRTAYRGTFQGPILIYAPCRRVPFHRVASVLVAPTVTEDANVQTKTLKLPASSLLAVCWHSRAFPCPIRQTHLASGIPVRAPAPMPFSRRCTAGDLMPRGYRPHVSHRFLCLTFVSNCRPKSATANLPLRSAGDITVSRPRLRQYGGKRTPDSKHSPHHQYHNPALENSARLRQTIELDGEAQDKAI